MERLVLCLNGEPIAIFNGDYQWAQMVAEELKVKMLNNNGKHEMKFVLHEVRYFEQ